MPSSELPRGGSTPTILAKDMEPEALPRRNLPTGIGARVRLLGREDYERRLRVWNEEALQAKDEEETLTEHQIEAEIEAGSSQIHLEYRLFCELGNGRRIVSNVVTSVTLSGGILTGLPATARCGAAYLPELTCLTDFLTAFIRDREKTRGWKALIAVLDPQLQHPPVPSTLTPLPFVLEPEP